VNHGRSASELRKLADVVQDVMQDVFAAPPGGRYQVITEHAVARLIAKDSGLGLPRTDDLVILQIFHQGRSAQQKTDWSFGHGRAQFLTGEL